jgi:hypothetical protein
MGDQSAVEWLLASEEPAVRMMTRRDVLGEAVDSGAYDLLASPNVEALLSGQREDGGFGKTIAIHRYRGNSRSPDDIIGVKYVDTGLGPALWRLVALADLAVPDTEPRVLHAANAVIDQTLTHRNYLRGPPVIDGLPRMCSSGEGAILVFATHLDMADDPRVERMVEGLLAWQWPDGGWNCHRNATGRRSNFHESIVAAWGLYEYATVTGDKAAAEAAERCAELFLAHRLLYSLGTGSWTRHRPNKPAKGQIINQRWTMLGYPSYWHYDVLAALRLLYGMGKLDDPRAHDALDLLESKRRPDGRWAADRQWWKPPSSRFTHQHEVVDWGMPKQPSEMITLNALRILRAAGRLG